MNKVIKAIVCLSISVIFLSSCSGGSPRNRGIESGKAACECYKLEDFESIESCLKTIEQENAEFLNDSAYTNAMEEQLLRCVSDGVIDFAK